MSGGDMLMRPLAPVYTFDLDAATAAAMVAAAAAVAAHSGLGSTSAAAAGSDPGPSQATGQALCGKVVSVHKAALTTISVREMRRKRC